MENRPAQGKGISENLSAIIYSKLKMELTVGSLRPGESLSIRTLADEYGVSAMPVREALRQLATEDLLIGAAKKAYRVPELTAKGSANLFFLRAVLEGAAVETAMPNIREGDLKALTAFTDEMEKATESGNAHKMLLTNFWFHDRIYSLAGNSALQSMIYNLYAQTGPLLAHVIINLVGTEDWTADHAKIIDALRTQDRAEARRLIEEDAQWGMRFYEGLVLEHS